MAPPAPKSNRIEEHTFTIFQAHTFSEGISPCPGERRALGIQARANKRTGIYLASDGRPHRRTYVRPRVIRRRRWRPLFAVPGGGSSTSPPACRRATERVNRLVHDWIQRSIFAIQLDALLLSLASAVMSSFRTTKKKCKPTGVMFFLLFFV
jgi:hypothetical protein